MMDIKIMFLFCFADEALVIPIIYYIFFDIVLFN
jgi:hypothetical protein